MGKKEKISILTFGFTNPTIVNTQTACVKLKLKNGSQMTLQVDVVPFIASRMERFPINLQIFEKVLSNYNLADDLPMSYESSHIDLLIENDYYGDIVFSKKSELCPGLYLMDSKLGFLITGRIQQRKLSNEEPANLVFFVSNPQKKLH